MNQELPNEFKKYAVKHHGISSMHLEKYTSQIGITDASIQNMTRTVIEERAVNFREVDVFSRLMMDRIIFLGTPIDDYIANIIEAQLLFLESADASTDIQIYINSPGGEVYSGLGIYDTMQYINPDVSTICTGIAASMSAVLLASGKKGKRTALKHSRVMIHQPLGGAGGQATDVMITVNEMKKLKHELYAILSEHSGQDFDKIAADSERDYWMIAEEAKTYGLIDEVLIRNKRKKDEDI